MKLPKEQDKSIFISWTVWAIREEHHSKQTSTASLWMNKELFISVPGSGNTSPKDMESLLPLMSMVMYSIDKAKKFRLNREVSAVCFAVFAHHMKVEPGPPGPYGSTAASRLCMTDRDPASCPWGNQDKPFAFLCAKGKQKADKNRARVEENFLKLTHVQRQEAAQSRREEKKRAEKERIMNEEDPEKQRRLEVRGCATAAGCCHIPPRTSPGLPVAVVTVAALISVCWRAETVRDLLLLSETRRLLVRCEVWCWRALFGSEMICLFLQEIPCVYSDPCPSYRKLLCGVSRRSLRRSRWRWSKSKWKPCDCCGKCLGATCAALIHRVQTPTWLQNPLTPWTLSNH